MRSISTTPHSGAESRNLLRRGFKGRGCLCSVVEPWRLTAICCSCRTLPLLPTCNACHDLACILVTWRRQMTRKQFLLPFFDVTFSIILGIALALPGSAQSNGPGASGPARVVPEIQILPEQVVEEQWPATMATVYPPK